ncbi:MAG TPA: VWA domain-containing protein [Acidimicrobiales bacterium]|nr:VWA domain-containing protein [Acidimicrobiales bacterium]
MADPDPVLERWRLVLGEAGHACTGGGGGGGGLGEDAQARDSTLEWLYRRESDLDRRDVRGAGLEASVLTTARWLDDVHRLFPRETIERLERDAVERYQIHEVVTDPNVLERIEPNATLLKAVLRTKHLMNPEVLRLARRIVEQVVRELMEKMATEIRQSFSGARSRRPSRLRRASSFDFRRTIQDNLRHYRAEERRLYVETAHFFSRTRRELDRWQIILVVDQSGSMAGSVIHSAVTAACLWSLPGVRTHLIAFDTAVVDLTADVDDPVELLMKVQLGGGTDIAKAVDFAAGLVDNPRRTIVVLITDFYEGGDPFRLVRMVRSLVEQGTNVMGLAALDEEANPDYNAEVAQQLANAGASVGAMTPGELAAFLAERIGR